MILALRHALEAARSLLFIGSGPRRLAVLALRGSFVAGRIGNNVIRISLVMVVAPPGEGGDFLEVESESRQLLLEVAPQGHYERGPTGDLSDCLLLQGKDRVRIDLRLVVPDSQLTRNV